MIVMDLLVQAAGANYIHLSNSDHSTMWGETK
jgi:hypothetical protein